MLHIVFYWQLFLMAKVGVICHKFIFFMALTACLIEILYQNFTVIVNIFRFGPIMQMIFGNLGNHLKIRRFRNSIVNFGSDYSARISTYMVSPYLCQLLFYICLFNCFFNRQFSFFLYFILCQWFAFSFLCFILNLHLLAKYYWIMDLQTNFLFCWFILK